MSQKRLQTTERDLAKAGMIHAGCERDVFQGVMRSS